VKTKTYEQWAEKADQQLHDLYAEIRLSAFQEISGRIMHLTTEQLREVLNDQEDLILLARAASVAAKFGDEKLFDMILNLGSADKNEDPAEAKGEAA
jgi:signal transduction protein with GAF and PtsI domain